MVSLYHLQDLMLCCVRKGPGECSQGVPILLAGFGAVLGPGVVGGLLFFLRVLTTREKIPSFSVEKKQF